MLAIDIESVSLAEPIFPESGITIFPPVVNKPAPVIAPCVTRAPFVVRVPLASCASPTLLSATFVRVERNV